MSSQRNNKHRENLTSMRWKYIESNEHSYANGKTKAFQRYWLRTSAQTYERWLSESEGQSRATEIKIIIKKENKQERNKKK